MARKCLTSLTADSRLSLQIRHGGNDMERVTLPSVLRRALSQGCISMQNLLIETSRTCTAFVKYPFHFASKKVLGNTLFKQLSLCIIDTFIVHYNAFMKYY